MSWEHINDDTFLRRMQQGWGNGTHEGTKCGSGSTLENTINMREQLPLLISKYGFKTMADAGAGDMHWIKLIEWDITIYPRDLVPRHDDVKQMDITKEALPECDVILCRTVLNHMDAERVNKALNLFRQSSKYLLATQHYGPNPTLSNDFTGWNLSEPPFNLGSPIENIKDCRNFFLSLWKL